MFSLDSAIADVFDRKLDERMERDAERRAVALARRGDAEATVALIRAYGDVLRGAVGGLIRSLGYRPQPADVEDLRSQAVLGLLEAIQVYDGEVHDRLAAIAPSYIRNAVSTAAASATLFTVPERTLKRFFGILREAHGNVYEAVRIAPDREMKAETFLAVLSAIRNVDSYDAVLANTGRDGEGGSGDVVAFPLWDNQTPDVEDRILVDAAFAAVNTFERDVVRLAYGFADWDPVPDHEIGARLGGHSRAAVQRTRSGALAKMRSALGAA